MGNRSGIFLATVLIGCLFVFSFAQEVELGTVIVGIDLGSSTSRVGVYMKDHVEIIPNDQGNRTTPTFVAFTDSQTLIGEAAKNQAAVNAERTIFDVKSLIGREFKDKEVQRVMKLAPYKIVNKDGKPYIQVQIKDGETKVFSPEEISAMFLTKMKETAEAFLGKKITDVFVTVPSYFNDAQRQATKDAAFIAGFNVVRIIAEPVSVAYAYGMHKQSAEKNILVFDLGDGAFDVTVLTVESGLVEVLSTTHARLGGEDFNQRVMEHLIKLIKNKYGKDISKDNRALVKLRTEAERANRALSNQLEVRVEVKSLFDGVDFSEPLTRGQLEELNKDLFRKTLGPVKKAMEDAGLKKHQIDDIILAGGSSNIPKNSDRSTLLMAPNKKSRSVNKRKVEVSSSKNGANKSGRQVYTMKRGVAVLAFLVIILAFFLAFRHKDGKAWAVLIAGSPGYHNYAMQADICHAYHVLKKEGLKEENIIVIMPDDVANDPRNPYPGKIIRKTGGPDVYHGVPKDYTGQNMTLENFLAITTGDKKSLKGGSRKVLSTNSHDRIFLFYSGHGNTGMIDFGKDGGHISSNLLLETLQKNYINNRYESMVMYVAACKAGSMFVKFDTTYKQMNIYIMTSSNAHNNSFQSDKDKIIGLAVSTDFGLIWIKDSERHNRKKRTLEQQHAHVKYTIAHTRYDSHVSQYGEKNLLKHKLYLYQGFV